MDKFINKIICGDCIEILKEIPERTIDFILTDPPFNVGIDYGESEYDDNMKDNEYANWCYKWIVECYRVLKDNHYCVVFTGDKKLFYVAKAIYNSNFIFHHFLKWYKPGCQRCLSGTVFFYRTELAFILSKDKPNISLIDRTVMFEDTLRYKNTSPNQKDAVEHNCRRPVGLYSHIIAGFTKKEDIVLDPFLGSGTTAIACKRLGRKFIGIEINPEYCKLSEERLNNESEPLF